MTVDFWCGEHNGGKLPKFPKTKPCITVTWTSKRRCGKRDIRNILIEAFNVLDRKNKTVMHGVL